ncbi:TPA: M15 family metallopeptidase [Serratia marcescens]|nr:M15 family metallopeptidase [Serratia marcescens]
MTWTLSQRSELALEGVHPDLIRVVRQALSLCPLDFVVIEGLRTPARQRELLSSGKTRTLNSRHLTGHAVDVVPLVNGGIPWEDWFAFEQVSKAMKQAGRTLCIPIIWGGDWVTFRDGPHYELFRGAYP